MLVSGVQQFRASVLTLTSIITICLHTLLVQCYWLYSLHCIFHLRDLLILCWAILIPFVYFTILPSTSPLVSISSLDLRVCFVHSFLDCTYKWRYSVFVFLSLPEFFTSFYISKLAGPLVADRLCSCSYVWSTFWVLVLNSLGFPEIPSFWNSKLTVYNSLIILSVAFIILTWC